jgi:hypothetical protein
MLNVSTEIGVEYHIRRQMKHELTVKLERYSYRIEKEYQQAIS